MMTCINNRRQFLRSMLAAPFVVKSGVLMPIKQIINPINLKWRIIGDSAAFYAPYIPSIKKVYPIFLTTHYYLEK